jgi:hypothetical protein
LLRGWLGNFEGNDRGEAWLRDHFNILLTEMQQRAPAGHQDLSHVVREHFTPDLAKQLSDEALAALIVRYSHIKGKPYENAQAIMAAEQVRRASQSARAKTRMARWTLFFAAMGVAVPAAIYLAELL